jgi:hypothetical protein
MKDKNIPSVYHAYKSRHVKYPSSLHVTLSGIPKPEVLQVRARSRLPTEIEIGRLTLEQVCLFDSR